MKNHIDSMVDPFASDRLSPPDDNENRAKTS